MNNMGRYIVLEFSLYRPFRNYTHIERWQAEAITLEVFCGMRLVNSVLESSLCIVTKCVGFGVVFVPLCMLELIPAIYIKKTLEILANPMQRNSVALAV